MSNHRIAALVAALAFIGASCGGGSGDPTETVAGAPAEVPPAATPAAPADPAPTPDPAAPIEAGPPSAPELPADVPDVDVLSVDTGESVNLQTFAQGQDTLFWLYAPH